MCKVLRMRCVCPQARSTTTSKERQSVPVLVVMRLACSWCDGGPPEKMERRRRASVVDRRRSQQDCTHPPSYQEPMISLMVGAGQATVHQVRIAMLQIVRYPGHGAL